MRVVIFCHSIRSDWNHGNAHFLRGVARELQERGHSVAIYEPENGWSARHLAADAGPEALDGYRSAYPTLAATLYRLPTLDLDRALDGADLVLVHEWNDPELVRRIGRARARGGGFRLLFHDTHHRSVSEPAAMEALDLAAYDGVLAFGAVVAERYRAEGWASRVWVWHEAADVRTFARRPAIPRARDIVWVGNWGDDERTAELEEFLLGPARDLGASGTVHGVRYPEEGRAAVEAAGLTFAGWIPNYRVPEVFAAHAVTVHIPRRPYVERLPGVPTIRVFEALACGIPLVSAPWDDVEHLFSPGDDFLVARNRREMTSRLRDVLSDAELAAALTRHGLDTIRQRHTCAHRVDELLAAAALLAPAGRACEPA